MKTGKQSHKGIVERKTKIKNQTKSLLVLTVIAQY